MVETYIRFTQASGYARTPPAVSPTSRRNPYAYNDRIGLIESARTEQAWENPRRISPYHLPHPLRLSHIVYARLLRWRSSIRTKRPGELQKYFFLGRVALHHIYVTVICAKTIFLKRYRRNEETMNCQRLGFCIFTVKKSVRESFKLVLICFGNLLRPVSPEREDSVLLIFDRLASAGLKFLLFAPRGFFFYFYFFH